MRYFLFRTRSESIESFIKRILRFLFTRTPISNNFPDILFGPNPDRDSPLYRKYLSKITEPKQTRSRLNLLFSVDTFTLKRILPVNPGLNDALLIWGENNRVASLQKEGYYHRDKCGIINFHVIRGCGHLLMYEDPGKTNQLIDKYIST
jgi:pimeloyl-ACP methyl ester carboxylesterase